MERLKKALGSDLGGALAVNGISFATGSTFTWPSPVGPKLQSVDPEINPLQQPTTVFEDSMVASMILPGCLVGVLIAGAAAERIGKKRTLLLIAVPMVLSHLMCAFARSINVILWARFLIGIGSGCQFAIVPSYVSEIVTEKERGACGSLICILSSIGTMFTYAVGPFASVKIFSFLNTIPLLLFLVAFSFCSESPYELLKNGEKEKAKNMLMLLRRKSDVQKEFWFIEETVRLQTRERGQFVDFLQKKSLRKALTITCVTICIQQFSGIGAFLAYMQSIFETSKIAIPANYSPIIVSSFATISNAISSRLIDRIGRKSSIIISLILLIISSGSLGTYYVLKSMELDLSSVTWLPVVSLIFFFTSYPIGLANVPWILIGEYFPASHKNVASTLTTFLCFFCCGIVTLCFPFVNIWLGQAGSFFIFTAVLSLGLVFVILVMPETKGMTFLEIQDVFKGMSKE